PQRDDPREHAVASPRGAQHRLTAQTVANECVGKPFAYVAAAVRQQQVGAPTPVPLSRRLPPRAPLMARYKHIDTSPRFLPVDLAQQLLPGTFEHAVHHLLTHALDLSAFDAR